MTPLADYQRKNRRWTDAAQRQSLRHPNNHTDIYNWSRMTQLIPAQYREVFGFILLLLSLHKQQITCRFSHLYAPVAIFDLFPLQLSSQVLTAALTTYSPSRTKRKMLCVSMRVCAYMQATSKNGRESWASTRIKEWGAGTECKWE